MPGMTTPLEEDQIAAALRTSWGFWNTEAEVARIAGGSGMKVLAWNRSPKTAAGVSFVDLDTLLAQSDVVSVNLLLNDETRGFLSAERIARIKPEGGQQFRMVLRAAC